MSRKNQSISAENGVPFRPTFSKTPKGNENFDCRSKTAVVTRSDARMRASGDNVYPGFIQDK